jgi:opacity protein-like surface antigen
MTKCKFLPSISGLLAVISLATFAYADQQDFGAAKTANAFLEIGPGARAVGMGEAFTAIADDVSSLYWNPAGLAYLPDIQVLLMHNQWLQNILYEYGAAAFPVFGGSLAASATYLNYGSMDKIDENGQDAGTFTAYDLSLTLGYGLRFSPQLAAGAAVKMPSSSIDNHSQSSVAADAGVLFRWPGLDQLQLGLSLLNIGSQVAGSAQPSQIKFGVACLDLMEGLKLGLDCNKHFYENALQVHGGAEYVVLKILALRAGYKYSSEESDLGSGLSGLTLGAGLSQRFGDLGLHLDYAFVPYGDLGATHRISLTLDLGTSPQISRPKPKPAQLQASPKPQTAAPLPTASAPQAPSYPPLVPPGKVSLIPSKGHIRLVWTSDTPNANFNIYMKIGKGKFAKLNIRPCDKNYFITGKLSKKKQYTFTVKTLDASGAESMGSIPVSLYLK